MKRRNTLGTALLLAFAAGFGNAALAQAPPAASGLDALLKQVQESAQETSRINQEREARFNRNKAEQAGLLQQAEAERAAAESRVAGVKARFDANQKEIAELKAQLAAKSGDYTQVYAGARQFAADLRPVLAESTISAQYPKRLAVLDGISKSGAQPSINQLESLWVGLQQELTEQGKSARFKADVVDPLGEKKPQEVTRVGVFAAFADGDYLAVPEGGGTLRALARQPARGQRALARDFAEATASAPGAREDILIDPSRGALLALQVDRPTVMERIHSGGWAAYIIIAVGIAGFALAVYQFVYLLKVDRKVKAQLADAVHPRPDNPLGRVLGVFQGDTGVHDPDVLELRLSEAVLKETPKIERAQQLIRLVIAAGPLLGLLGTVAGMIETFQVITENGAGDPKLMAGGISQAMICTVLGLGIAIPLLFINAWLTTRSRALVQILDEQSAGLLAERLEAQLKGHLNAQRAEPARA